MVAIPIERASGGTWAGSPPKRDALLRRVSGLSTTRCVRDCSTRAGSLNPMCPFVPMPSTWRSIHPTSAIFFSYRAHSASGSGALPSRTFVCSGGMLTRLNRCRSMKLR